MNLTDQPIQQSSHLTDMTGQPRAVKPPRYAFVDLLRGWALVIMIETHVVNSYLPQPSRHTLFFFWLTFLNGLVAPSFLFASGYSLALQLNRNWIAWLRCQRPFWINMRRMGFIALVAYCTHIQFKLSSYQNAVDVKIWKETFQVDILQCIVMSLLVVQAMAFIFRKPARAAYAAAVFAIAISLVTPWAWSIDFTRILPLPMALFLNPHGISLFPLFPWVVFVLAGFVAGQAFLKSVALGRDPFLMAASASAGVGMILLGLLGRWAPWTLPGHVNYYTTSPSYVLVRLGCVVILCSALYWMERRQAWMPAPVRTAGQESLLVYGAHLFVIFAVLRGGYLGPILGLEHGYFYSLGVSLALIAGMLWLASGWNYLKKNYAIHIRRAQAIVVAATILAFFLR